MEATHVKAVVARKQPYVIYDTNRYSIPHDYVGVNLTVVASEEEIRVLHAHQPVARHARSWRKKQVVEDPAHIEALAAYKRRGQELKAER